MPKNSFRLLLILLFFVSIGASGQNLAILIKLNVDGGNFNETKVTVTENGKEKEVFSPAKSKMIPELEFDNDYVITFEKPGYITKRVEISTQKVPEDIREADLDFDFAVEIFEQYEGVNTVIFNQPVAKWFYDTQEDEFTYDTDYTKSIRSALINFEKEYEEVKKSGPKVDEAALAAKQAEEIRLAAEAKAKSEDEKRKLAEAKAAEEERERLTEEKRLADEKLKKEETERAQQLANDKKAAAAAEKLEEEEQREAQLKADQDERKSLKAKAEEEKRLAKVKAEEEKRLSDLKTEEEARNTAALKADEEEKAAVKAKLEDAERARKKAELEAEMKQSKLDAAEETKRREQLEKEEIEQRQQEADLRRVEEERMAAEQTAETEKRKIAEAAKAEADARKQASENAAFEEDRKKKAKAAFEAQQRAQAQAQSVSEAQKRDRFEAMEKMEEERKSLSIKDAGNVVSRTKEVIEEVNRTITLITISRERMTYVYKKVAYNWGGVYYFRDDDSITNDVFKLETAN